MADMNDPVPEKPSNTRKKRLRAIVCFLLGCAVLVVGSWWFLNRNRIYTDDAYAEADSAVISTRVSGTISAIKVENDDQVAAGESLLELDPSDYQSVVDKDRAALVRIEEEIRVSEISVKLTDSQTNAQVRAGQASTHVDENKEIEARHRLEELEKLRMSAQADCEHAKRDLDRYSNLYKAGAGAEQQVDRTNTAYKKARAQCDAVDAQIAAAHAALAAVMQNISRARAQLDTAVADKLRVDMEKHKLAALKARLSETQAELQAAELNLSYCTIKAPISGYVAQKRIQLGDRVQPGQGLLAVVPLQEVYVEANFKENQLKDVRIGQSAEIEADAYPGYCFHGKVVGIRAGTGAAFSLLPPENATGNWIKVVQRIPVKIRLDEPPPHDYPLRVGSSLGVTVNTADKSGPRLVQEKSDRRS